QFTLNGRSYNNFSYSASTKILSANVDLSVGNNTIVIKASNKDGSDSETVNIRYEVPKVLPEVKITSPRNNTSTDKATTTVKATIKNVSRKSDVIFSVNGKQLNSFDFRRNAFSANVNLKKGRNIIKITASIRGGSDSDQIQINYTPKVIPMSKPVIKFTNPRRSGGRAKKKDITIRANVKYVTTKGQIKVSLDGRAVVFNFDSRKQEVTAPITLKNGTNKIVIVASNKAGTTTEEVIVRYKSKPASNVKKPEITITSVSTPTANPLNPTALGSTMIGTVENVTDRSQITITYNGKKITDFTFEPRAKRFQVSIALDASGNNKVIISATNRAGTATKEHTY
ncbi:MAG: hypothetical protein AAF573_15135, partial [Bacteroidota bacterium]